MKDQVLEVLAEVDSHLESAIRTLHEGLPVTSLEWTSVINPLNVQWSLKIMSDFRDTLREISREIKEKEGE